jgi:hypothetical protein
MIVKIDDILGTILSSLPGCQAQLLHGDNDYTIYESQLSLNFIVAVQNNSRFVVMHNKKKKIIRLNRGDLLIFRGHVIHGGASYRYFRDKKRQYNLRFHFHADVKGTKHLIRHDDEQYFTDKVYSKEPDFEQGYKNRHDNITTHVPNVLKLRKQNLDSKIDKMVNAKKMKFNSNST